MKRTVLLIMVTVLSCFLLCSASNVTAQDACEGNFDCDQDVDGTDAAVFKEDFGRSAFKNPCPSCQNNPCPNYYDPCVSNEDCDSGCCCDEADFDLCHDQTYCETVIGSQCINSNTSCITGETRPCGSDLGECEYGVETCTDGVWGNCVGGITPTVEVCDGLDNDCDGIFDEGFSFIDWDGSTLFMGESCGTGACALGTVECNVVGDGAECSSNVNASNEICDGLDNDCDGTVDEDCETNCSDGIDNDGDGYTDCDDFDCALDPACEGIYETNCTDNIDNDGDGYVDCDDFDCNFLDPACEGANCSDGIDNDGDGFVDCDDLDCVSDPACA